MFMHKRVKPVLSMELLLSALITQLDRLSAIRTIALNFLLLKLLYYILNQSNSSFRHIIDTRSRLEIVSGEQ